MTPARQQLLDMILEPDTAFDQQMSDMTPLQLRAAQELFEERRTQIPLVNRRAEEAGIDRINSLQDIVPLLFAHTVYKSYPPSFVEQGRWDRMLQWLNTLSVDDVMSVDVDAVLLARTLWRNLEVDWPCIEVIVRLTAQLNAARRRVQELEAAVATRERSET